MGRRKKAGGKRSGAIEEESSMEEHGKTKTFLNKCIAGIGLLGGILVLLNGLFVTYEVIMRYVFNSPTTWVLETTIYLIIAATFISLAYVMLEKGHVKVDFVTVHLSHKTAALLETSTSVFGILYCMVLGWQGWKVTVRAFQLGERSPTLLGVPLWIPELFIPLGCALLTFQFIRYTKEVIETLSAREFAGERATATDYPTDGISMRQWLAPIIFIVSLAVSLVFLKVNLNLGLLLLFFVLLFSGLPVSFALGLFGVFAMYFGFTGGTLLMQIPVVAYSTLDSNVTVALPLFVLTSCVLRNGEIGGRIYKFADVLVRHLPGGLGIASVIFCCLFASMTGNSVAVAATVSMIALPEMLERGYSRKFTIGLLCAGGTLGILFPPSLPLMLYGAMTGESVGALFAATLIPGLILAAMFCIYVAFVSKRDKNIQRLPRASFKEIVASGKGASGGLITIIIIMGGIYSGIFTPTESGGISAVYSIILCCFIYRTLSFEGLKKSILEMIKVNSMIMLIVIGANITGQVVLMAQIPQDLLAWVKSMAVPPWAVILAINIFLILLGGPLEAITILVITLPILYPLVTSLGFSGLWFAVIMVVNMELALISPPEGLNLFILQNMAKATAAEVSWGVVPFLIIMAIFLALISFMPSLATWLPTLAAS
jgi:C4-dicarboxylate transporter, DctM subunit